LWVIPNYKEQPISENKAWCAYILSLNRTMGMHGINHYYREFKEDKINQEKLNSSKEIFKECFGYEPTIFKAPKLMLSRENKILLEKNNFEIKGKLNQIIHKVYHCGDTGTLPNYLHDLI
jgi:predicted deacetylase